MSKYQKQIESFMNKLVVKDGHEPEFIQAVEEVAETVIPFIETNEKYKKNKILERIVEPERVIQFRVPWLDDLGEPQVNRGFRVEFNSAIGPYKGGLRFHPSVNLSILKFLGFEQIFKNSLTTLPMGGGKGGSDFNPKGKSDNEVMNFCQSFMTELSKHIGPNTDVPAGDIGVGGREIGYMFGQYKRIRNEFTGVLTGKGINWGGSLIRPEATGYGVVYFAEKMLSTKGHDLKGKIVSISGSGNVAQFACEKCIQLGAKVVTMSDSKGYIYDSDGLNEEKLSWLMDLKNIKRGRIYEYSEKFSNTSFYENKKPWEVKVDVALPCATQNELAEEHANLLVQNGCVAVVEGANMPCSPDAIAVFTNNKILFSPGKASNAGGVATSGLEMSQNSLRYNWKRDEVDQKLKDIMLNIHEQCVNYGMQEDGYIDYVKGANLAGFVKVADAMIDQGLVEHMYRAIKKQLKKELKDIDSSGLFKKERIITSAQGASVFVDSGKEVIIMCANNYLGLSSNKEVIDAAKSALETHGFGMSSVRFICGTQDIHKELEKRIADFYSTEDTILYAAAFDANGGLFEPLFGPEDAIISDELNHASIIDGIRLCKAKRFRYKHSDMQDLENQLKEAQNSRNKIIVTDGVFSMDGDIAKLNEICDLADQYEALVMTDECHSAGFIGKTGRGVPEYHNVINRVDIITGTLGKALGGAMGGYTTGKQEIIEILRQKSRPYLFSNSLAPSIVGAANKVFEILSSSTQLRDQLEKNTKYFKNKIIEAGFDVKDGNSPIIPIMLYDATLSQRFADMLLDEGVYVVGFFYPVVPKGKARIRTQISAAHSKRDLDIAINAFIKVGKKLRVI